MIVRSVLNNSNLDSFDFFNDLKDTLQWLSNMKTPEAEQARQTLENLYKKKNQCASLNTN